MGLGLAIDYSLFIVSRYREELRRGLERRPTPSCAPSRRPGAPSRSARSPSPCRCRPCWCSRIVLPALVRLRRHRRRAAGDARRDRRPARRCLAVARSPDRRAARPAPAPAPEGRGATASGTASAHGRHAAADPGRHRRGRRAPAARRPVPPGRTFGTPDDRVLPQSAPAPAGLDDRCAPTSTRRGDRAFPVVVTGHRRRRRRRPRRRTPSALSALAGRGPGRRRTGRYTGGAPARRRPTRRPPGFAPTADTGWMSVVPTFEPGVRRRRALVHDVRGLDPTTPTCWSAGRPPSSSTPRRRSSAACRWPSASSWSPRSCCCSCSFGSVLVPIKALVLNMLSLTATFGAMVWIFQDGHLARLLGFTADRRVDTHDADPDVLHRLRAVDGLRGVPALADQGGARPHRRQRPRSVALGPGAHRPHRHRRGRAPVASRSSPSPRPASASSSCSASGSASPC